MSYPTPAGSIGELMSALSGSVHVADGRLVVDDEARLRSDGIRALAWSATFSVK